MTDQPQTAAVLTRTGDWAHMVVCGGARPHRSQSVIIVRDEHFRCYAARETPDGYAIVWEAVELFW